MGNKALNTDLVDRASIFAIKAHAGTERRGKGFPYIIHPMEAMSIVASITKDPELLAAAVLHDTVEDTDITIEDLRREFGERVASIVESESDKFIEGVSEEDSWHSRKQAAIDRLAKAPRDAKIVALGDKLSNMRAITRDYEAMGDELWKIFHAKNPSDHMWHYRGLANSLSELADTAPYKEFVKLVDHVFGKCPEGAVLVNLADYEKSGEGHTAESYNHKDGKTMMKLYADFMPKEVPENEKKISDEVYSLGILTPKAGRVVTDGRRIGVEFQRLMKKRSFARIISQEPQRLEELAVTFAGMCRKLHATPCDTSFFCSAKEFFGNIIDKDINYSEEQKDIMRKFLAGVPEETTCLHGDMHFGNVISDGVDNYWIDLGDFRYGNPLFDLGMFYLVCKRDPDELTQELYHITNAQAAHFWEIFIREYFEGKLTVAEAEEKILPFGALLMLYFASRESLIPLMDGVIQDAFFRK